MPSAVMMEENFDKLLEQCEAQELEVSLRRWSSSPRSFTSGLNLRFRWVSKSVWLANAMLMLAEPVATV